MNLPVSIRITAAALFMSALSLFLPFPGPLQAVSGLLLSYVLPGLVFLMLIGERRPAGLHRLVAAPILSPLVLAVLVLAVHAAVGSFESSVTISVLVLEALLAIAILRRGSGEEERAPAIASIAVPLSLLFGGIVVACYLINPGLLMRSDAWYHASVAREILDRGVPPLEPWLPDVPIRYMWIYHLFVASTMRLAGLGVFAALGVFNVAAAFVFPWLAARIVSFFAKDRKTALFAALIVVAGLQSAAWVFFPLGFVGAAVGETRGAAELMRLIGNIDLDSFRVIYFLSPFEDAGRFGNYMVSLADKHLTITAFGFALNVFLFGFAASLSTDLRRRVPAGAAVLVFAAALGALLFHAIVGAAFIIAVVGSGIFLAAAARLRYRERLCAAHSIILPAAALAAAIVAFPYVYSLTRGGSSGGEAVASLHAGFRNIATMALPLIPLWRPVTRVFRDLCRGADDGTRIAGAWIASLAALCLFANLPTRNESKLVFPFFLLLSPLVAARIVQTARGKSGRRRAAWTVWTSLLIAAPFVLTLRGFILDRPRTPAEARRGNVSGADRDLFDWIRAHTPPDAAIIEGESNYNMMPVFARRRNFAPPPSAMFILGYGGSQVNDYMEAQSGLFDPASPCARTMETLRRVERPLYVVLWNEISATPESIAHSLESLPMLVPVFRNSSAHVYAVSRE